MLTDEQKTMLKMLLSIAEDSGYTLREYYEDEDIWIEEDDFERVREELQSKTK
jgi:hypothetical protein